MMVNDVLLLVNMNYTCIEIIMRVKCAVITGEAFCFEAQKTMTEASSWGAREVCARVPKV